MRYQITLYKVCTCIHAVVVIAAQSSPGCRQAASDYCNSLPPPLAATPPKDSADRSLPDGDAPRRLRRHRSSMQAVAGSNCTLNGALDHAVEPFALGTTYFRVESEHPISRQSLASAQCCWAPLLARPTNTAHLPNERFTLYSPVDFGTHSDRPTHRRLVRLPDALSQPLNPALS